MTADSTRSSNRPHWYELHLSKGSLSIELASDDVYFMTQQMTRWFSALVQPVENTPPPVENFFSHSPQNLEPQEIPTESPAVQNPVETVGEDTPIDPLPPALEETLEPLPEPEKETEEELPPPEVALEPETLKEEEDLSQVDLPFSTPTIPVTAEKESLEPPINDIDTVLNSMMEDLSLPEEAEVSEEVEEKEESVLTELVDVLEEEDEEEEALEDFEEILEPVKFSVPGPSQPEEEANDLQQSEPEEEPLEDLVESLADLLDQIELLEPADTLIAAAYYLVTYEATPQFSLKSLNQELQKANTSTLTHREVETVLEKGYIEMVQETDDLNDVVEYLLTDAGRQWIEVQRF